jgi:hypothetical protein
MVKPAPLAAAGGAFLYSGGLTMPQLTISPQALEKAMQEAAARLILCETRWVGHWIVYLLECLDSHANVVEDTTFTGTLQAVRDAITTRLEDGRW